MWWLWLSYCVRLTYCDCIDDDYWVVLTYYWSYCCWIIGYYLLWWLLISFSDSNWGLDYYLCPNGLLKCKWLGSYVYCYWLIMDGYYWLYVWKR